MGKTVFLDRDGVIHKKVVYLYRSENFEFIDGGIRSLQIFPSNEL
jgi:histidinol phosphatase-like enzyme